MPTEIHTGVGAILPQRNGVRKDVEQKEKEYCIQEMSRSSAWACEVWRNETDEKLSYKLGAPKRGRYAVLKTLELNL